MSITTGRNFRLLLVLLAAICTLPVASANAQANPPKSSAALPGSSAGQYAETDICKTCHQDVWDKHFANTPHAALLKGDQHGCQACHGPGQAHVEGGGDVTKIIRFETLSPAETAAICTKCHQSSLETQNFPGPNISRMVSLAPTAIVRTAPRTSTFCW